MSGKPLSLRSCGISLTGLGITAGYHRLFAHRAYEAKPLLKYILLIFGTGSFQGSAQWWARGHRAHHRYTDTDLDPYSAHKGIFYAHIGWLLIKPSTKTRCCRRHRFKSRDPSYSMATSTLFNFSLSQCPLSSQTLSSAVLVGVIIVVVISFAGVLRLVFVHHSTFQRQFSGALSRRCTIR